MVSETLRPSPFITGDVDDLFYCWRRVPSTRPGLEESFEACRAGEYWRFNFDEVKYTDFSSSVYFKPKGIQTVSLRSKGTFTYGVFVLKTILPRADGGPMLWFGFESDDLFAGGAVHYCWFSGKGSLTANVGGIVKLVTMDLSRFLPSDASSNYHWYSIVYRRGLALWYIDGRLRALAAIASGDVKDGGVVYDKPPYIASWTTDAPAPQLAVLLDIDAAPNVEFKWIGLNPWGLRVANGDAEAPVSMRLYIEGTEGTWDGVNINPGDELVTPPLPGMGNKTLTISAPSSTLSVESFTGNDWVEVNRLSINGAMQLAISGNALLIRLRLKANQGGRITGAQYVLE